MLVGTVVVCWPWCSAGETRAKRTTLGSPGQPLRASSNPSTPLHDDRCLIALNSQHVRPRVASACSESNTNAAVFDKCQADKGVLKNLSLRLWWVSLRLKYLRLWLLYQPLRWWKSPNEAEWESVEVEESRRISVGEQKEDGRNDGVCWKVSMETMSTIL